MYTHKQIKNQGDQGSQDGIQTVARASSSITNVWYGFTDEGGGDVSK